MDEDHARKELEMFKAQLPNYNPEACLDALRDLIGLTLEWRDKSAAQTTPPEIQSRAEDLNCDPDADSLCAITYRDAACAHSAIGALAPFYEGVFQHEFAALRVALEWRKRELPKTHHRWQLEPDDFWSLSVVSEKGTKGDNPDVARTAGQLFAALAIGDKFPPDFAKVVKALFAYRNRALHNGYEWPTAARDKFAELASKSGWSDWFAWSTIGGELWISSVADDFIAKCLDTGEKMVKGFHEVRASWAGYPADWLE